MRRAALLLIFAAACVCGRLDAQSTPTCSASLTSRPVRTEGMTELVADVVLTCTGGVRTLAAAPIPTDNFTLSFNAPVTSRILGANGASEALLLLDEPSPTAQFPCDQSTGTCPGWGNGTGAGYYGGGVQSSSTPNNRNVFQGFVGPSIGNFFEISLPQDPNAISWIEIPVDPPGPGTRIFRFTNIRLDATAIGSGTLQLTAITISGSVPLPVSPSTLTVGTPKTSLAAGVRDAADATAAPAGVVASLSTTGIATTRYATLRFAGAIPSAGRPRTTAPYVNADTSPAPVNQNSPGVVYNSESGFYNGTFGTYGPGGNLGLAGLADSGTRYMAVFSNVPSGFQIYVDLNNSTAASGPTARLVSTDALGAGLFSAVPGSAGLAQLTVTNGTAVAVWEVLRNTTAPSDTFDFGVYLSYAAGVTTPPPPIGVQMRYAPFAGVGSPQVIPQFAGIAAAQTLITFVPPPSLTVAPASLSFSATLGQNPAPQSLSIGSTGGSIPFSVSSSAQFPIVVQPPSGNTPGQVSVSVVAQSLSAGSYTGRVAVSSPGGSTVVVPVYLSVSEPPSSLVVAPAVLTFIGTAGGRNPAAQSVTVDSTGSPIRFDTTSSGPIPLTVQPASGITPAGLSVSVNTQGLAARTYANTIAVVGGTSTATVAVALILNPGPQITSLDPSGVAAGSPAFTLTVNGLNFTSTTTVRWNGSALPTAFVNSGKLTAQIAASLVASPGTASITAVTSDGAVSNAVPLPITQFAITALDPSKVVAGGPAFTLTVSGVGFVPGVTVNVGGGSAAPASLTPTQLTVSVPASTIVQPGAVAVSVTHPSGIHSNSLDLTVTPPLQLISIAPTIVTATNPGFVMTLNGTGFATGATVQVGGSTLQPTGVSSTQITVAVPAGLLLQPGALDVQVTNPGNQASNKLTLTVSPKPAITALSPSSLPAGAAAFTLTVSGTDLPSNAVVQWNGQAIPTSAVSRTQLTAQVSASLVAAAGTASITAATPDGIVTNALTFTITPVPTITSLNPTTVTVGGSGVTLTVTGANFSSTSVVQWNGQSLATTFVSSTQLTAVVPPSLVAKPGTVTIQVVTGGVGSGSVQLTVALPPLSGVSLTVPRTASSGQDQTITLALGGTYPVDVVATLTLTFTGDAGLPDDPAIQFQNSSRTITFNVPAGSSLQAQQIAVKTGTLAGVITITPVFTASGTNVTPASVTPQTIQIARAAPSLTSVTCTRTAGGFTVVVDGFTNTREATQATFDFQSASGAALATNELVVNAGSLFSSWFGGTASAGAGGLFRYTQPFTVQGNSTDIASVAVKVANTSGASAQGSCKLQ